MKQQSRLHIVGTGTVNHAGARSLFHRRDGSRGPIPFTVLTHVNKGKAYPFQNTREITRRRARILACTV